VIVVVLIGGSSYAEQWTWLWLGDWHCLCGRHPSAHHLSHRVSRQTYSPTQIPWYVAMLCLLTVNSDLAAAW